jgi:hypothetical protein
VVDEENSVNQDDLMAELHRRVAAKKAAGLYSVDALVSDRGPDREPFDADTLVRLQELSSVYPDLAVARSTKPIVGRAVSGAKAGAVRVTKQPLLDLASRTTAFNMLLLSYVTTLAQEIEVLRSRVEDLERSDVGADSPG